eukprot:g374.t1
MLSTVLAQVDDLPDKDYSIYGKALQRDIARSFPDITRKCFYGFGFIACENVGEPPNLVNSPYHWRTAVKDGRDFCLQCCNNLRQERTFSETWNLRCDVSRGASDPRKVINTDPYQWEFRFARRETLSDQGMVVCPIVRPPEVWVVRISNGGGSAAPVSGYFRLVVGGRKNALENTQRTGLIQHDAVAMKWQEKLLSQAPGSGIGQSVEAMLMKALQDLEATRGRNFPRLYPVEVSRSGGNGTGYSWSITFPQNEFPSILDDDPNNHFLFGDGIGLAPATATLEVSQAPATQMWGYTLDVEVREKFDGIKYWRNVRACNVTTIERAGAPTHFSEAYHLYSTESAASARAAPTVAGGLVLSLLLAVSQSLM